ncbi:hypothetical protein ACH5RR_037598 [Cinchona calisaya]|uniref:Uncharacterized protein n=1 Tax=Cinchona calisaya TaxID=153742 RepID=A0ABD2YAS6_9GENT
MRADSNLENDMILCSDNSVDVQFALNTTEEQDDTNALQNISKKINEDLNEYKTPLEPCEGMIFDDLEDCHTFYKAYSEKRSFSEQYILDRWTINAKDKGYDETFADNLEEPQDGFELLRNNLIIEFLEVVEMGYCSQEQYNKIKCAIKKIREEFLIMGNSSENLMGCDFLASAVAQDIDDQVMSNVDFKLQNPTHAFQDVVLNH